jgi:anti-sigma B factor antagonist
MSEYRRRLEIENIGDVTVVNFVDRKILDEENMRAISEQLFSLVDEDGMKKILLNFSSVEYLSSHALGKFVTLKKKLHEIGGELILCNIDPFIYEVFEITGLDKFFKIEKPRKKPREDDEDDDDDGGAGVPARLIPPKPSGGGHVKLPPPSPE